MTVYVDQVWLLNTLLDYLLLVATAQFCGHRIRRRRFFLVALLGGAYGAAGFLWPVLHGPFLRLPVGVVLGYIAFRREQKCAVAVASFFLLSTALAGTILALGLCATGVTWYILLLSSGVFYLVLEILFRQAARFGRSCIQTVRIAADGKECTLRALHDTGNTLRSPVNGAAVLVAESAALRDMWSREEAEVLLSGSQPQEKVARLYQLGSTRFSLIPYATVGNSGLMLCMRSDRVMVGKKVYHHAPVALTEQRMGANYEALWGGEEEHYEVAAVHTGMDPSQAG